MCRACNWLTAFALPRPYSCLRRNDNKCAPGATSQTWIPGRGPGMTNTKTSATAWPEVNLDRDGVAVVILVFRNRPILVHDNKKYDYSGVARVRSHCMAPIPACAGMNPSEAQDAARTQSAGDT